MVQCEKAFEPLGNHNMCAKFALASYQRSGKNCRAAVAPDFPTEYDVCLSNDSAPVSTLQNGWMSPDAATFACFNSRNASANGIEQGNNCAGFWYYPRVNSTDLQAHADPNPQVQCDVDLPWYGEMLITDLQCPNKSCTGPCQHGCIGAENPTCSRCIYDEHACQVSFTTDFKLRCLPQAFDLTRTSQRYIN